MKVCEICGALTAKYRVTITDLDGNVLDSEILCHACYNEAELRTVVSVPKEVK